MLSDRSLSVLCVLSVTLTLRLNGLMDQDATWCGGRPQPRPHCAVWGPNFAPKGHIVLLQFSSDVCQMAGWIKMPLSREVGLGPDDTVLDGTQLPQKGAQPTNLFGPCILWSGEMAEWTKIPTWYGGRHRSRLHWDLLPKMGHSSVSSTFRPMSIVAKRLDKSRCFLARR